MHVLRTCNGRAYDHSGIQIYLIIQQCRGIIFKEKMRVVVVGRRDEEKKMKVEEKRC